MSDPNTVNYQPLTAMQGAWKKVFEASLHGLGLAAFIALIVITVGSIVIRVGDIIIYAVVLYFAFLSYRVNVYKNNVWQAFATANGWPLNTTTSVLELIPPSMQFGHSEKFSPIINATLGAMNSDLFTYSCVTGSGRYQQTHNFTVGRMVLPKNLPHILLLSKKSKADVQRDLANSQDLQLEGNFGDYFKLQIESGQQIDVLTVLTPDVMQTLVSYNTAEDIEILGDDLYFIMNGDKRDYADVESLVRSVVELSQQIILNIGLANILPPAPPPPPSLVQTV